MIHAPTARSAPVVLTPYIQKSTLEISNGTLHEMSLKLVIPRTLVGTANKSDITDALGLGLDYATGVLAQALGRGSARTSNPELFFDQINRFIANDNNRGSVHASMRHFTPIRDEAYVRIIAQSVEDLDGAYDALHTFFGFIPPKSRSETNGLGVHRDYQDARARNLQYARIGVKTALGTQP